MKNLRFHFRLFGKLKNKNSLLNFAALGVLFTGMLANDCPLVFTFTNFKSFSLCVLFGSFYLFFLNSFLCKLRMMLHETTWRNSFIWF